MDIPCFIRNKRNKLTEIFSDKLPDMKIITGFDKDFISSISKCEYIGDDIPMLIIDDNSQLSKAICSFLDGLETAVKVRYILHSTLSHCTSSVILL